MCSHKLPPLLLLGLVLLTPGASVRATQPLTGTGSIAGIVRTALDDAPIPETPITATSVTTGTEFTTSTDQSGRYSLSGLPAGRYEVSAQYPPFFIPYRRGDIDVLAGQETKLDIQLVDFQNTLGDGGSYLVKLVATQPAPEGPTPRAQHGRPDLSGVWLPNVAKPVGEFPQALPWADAVARERQMRGFVDAPSSRCLPNGLSFAGTWAPYRLIQTPELVVVIDENGDPPREIHLDGRERPADLNPTYMGHSLGRWDGDTLVVDTVGFNDRPWLTFAGWPQTENMRVTERFTRPDLGHLEVEMTFDDPGAFHKPFTLKRVSSLAPEGSGLMEYVCAENNKYVPTAGN